MKKLMFLVMMTITIIGKSQTLGYGFSDFMRSDKSYEKKFDENGKLYLIEHINDNTSFTYRFQNGICKYGSIISYDVKDIKKFYFHLADKTVKIHKTNGREIIELEDNTYMYFYKTKVDGDVIYVIDYWLE